MPWREALEPVRMQRIAIVVPTASLREVLVRTADAGTVELDGSGVDGPVEGEAARRLRRMQLGTVPQPRLSRKARDLDELEREGRVDLIAGEAELELAAGRAFVRDEVAALAGWSASADLGPLAARLADAGGGVVRLPAPRGIDPPTQLRSGGAVRRAFSPLVQTYATVPYADIDPTALAAVAFVAMFGMMFGDVGHGALLILLALLIRAGRPAPLARFKKAWPVVAGAGIAATAFGLLYGEFFGPTGVVPVLWLAPLEEPVALLAAAVGAGAVLIAGSYVLGTVNRWREGGWPVALSASSGLAGASLFAGLGVALLGAQAGMPWAVGSGVFVAAAGLILTFVGFLAAVPAESGRGAAGVGQASVELFDAVIRLGTNFASFARLAAFGLTHAALGLVVWEATTGLWQGGGLSMIAAGVVFVVGNGLAFALEALVAGVQALRLEYYELFSRVFTLEGRPFEPWRVQVECPDDATKPLAAQPAAARRLS